MTGLTEAQREAREYDADREALLFSMGWKMTRRSRRRPVDGDLIDEWRHPSCPNQVCDLESAWRLREAIARVAAREALSLSAGSKEKR